MLWQAWRCKSLVPTPSEKYWVKRRSRGSRDGMVSDYRNKKYAVPNHQSKLRASSRLHTALAMPLPTWVIQQRRISTLINFPQHASASTAEHANRKRAACKSSALEKVCSGLHCYEGMKHPFPRCNFKCISQNFRGAFHDLRFGSKRISPRSDDELSTLDI
jgi:hypothetical protein